MLRPFLEKALAKSFPGDFRESPPDPSKLYQACRPATARARPVSGAQGRAFGKVPRTPQSFISLPPCHGARSTRVRGSRDALSRKSPGPLKASSGRPPCHGACSPRVRGSRDALSGKSPGPLKALSGRPPCHGARSTRVRGAGTRFRESPPDPSKLHQAGRPAPPCARPVSKAVGKARRALQPGKFML